MKNPFKKVKKEIIEIDEKREELENNAADLMDKISKNETYIKLKNKGADKLVALGIQAGIAFAESQSGQNITVSDETIDKIADKGGDCLVIFWGKFIGLIKKQLRK